ncbi:metabolite traffic protein EboE [Blastopirellula sp. JC732]|uniref:Metabolite traffic protein EboE n=1 Tax=Blastopirellula sediminis TaxID=2894196 RepID=A0A9X1SGY9_9BACT|nr:metabolite traffic protein EboE [Blastopirellula sediminis]MCC9606810.1 metabolite traffic protein EboE [Blastopirellula sediminis]MCC9629893.1 metabolite traffic protein EboE [Blastopirellula sediminis]
MSLPDWIGYCTNVHAGANLAETEANLQKHAVRVRQLISPRKPMGVGLWLSAVTAKELRDPDRLARFRGFLNDNQLIPYTLNGFPYGNFHQAVVKHAVYEPTWIDPLRLQYTLDLAHILDELLPPGEEGSISTLPIAWGDPPLSEEAYAAVVANFLTLANELARIEQSTGRLIYVCIEPEPGCAIDTTADMIAFFQNRLFPAGDPAQIARYIRVCHDVCHAAVMCEDQSSVLSQYAAAGISVGKVQISSAIEVDFESLSEEESNAAIQRLMQFAEDRYLHQTMAETPSGERTLHEDLPAVLNALEGPPEGIWRIHFHMPIYIDAFGPLRTTQGRILDLLRQRELLAPIKHFEVETYAWTVLPPELRQEELAAGIATEIDWLKQQLR